MDHNWDVKPLSGNVHQINFYVDDPLHWEQYVLITADRHHDNVHSLHDLQKRHLDLAVERDAPIVDVGDFHDVMGSRNDPRRDLKALRPEHKESEAYFDLVLDSTEQFFAPYASQFAVLGYGNHETKALKHANIDMVYNTKLRLERHSPYDWPYVGGYGGYIRYQFYLYGKSRYQSVLHKYYHGSGGGGPVTKGVIQANRRAVFTPDADIITTGHIHEGWLVPYKQERCSQRGKVETRIQWHVSTPTYKDEYGDGSGGWHVERGQPPKPVGAVWIRFYWDAPNRTVRPDFTLDAI